MKVLVYVRPWSSAYFNYLATNLFGSSEVTFISDHKNCLGGHFARSFYKNYFQNKNNNNHLLKNTDYADIIFRDRLLRSISREKAYRLINAMEISIMDEIKKQVPKMILSITVDCYVTDLLARIGFSKGVPFFGITTPFINNYTLITARGELNSFREVSSREVENVLKELERESYKASYMKKYPVKTSFMLKQWFKNLIKVPWFFLKMKLGSDPLNYHNWGSFLLAKQKSRIGNILVGSYTSKDWRKKYYEERKKGLVFYLPLQLYPEMNAEYWSPYKDFMLYEEGILRLLMHLPKDVMVLVKEHPAMLGLRHSGFYKSLCAIKQVVLVPAHVSQRELINKVNCAITMNSTVGVEAILAGKPVLTVGKPYYSISRLHINVSKLEDLHNLPKFLKQKEVKSPLTREEMVAFFRKILSGCLPQAPDECFFDKSSVNDCAKADFAVEQLKTSIPKWLNWFSTVDDIMPSEVLYE